MLFRVRLLVFVLLAAAIPARGALAQLQQFPTAPLTIESAGGSHKFSIQVATTPAQMEQGLMFRRSLAPDGGMIFDFRMPSMATMWMKNTLIPLDMVFVAKSGLVNGVRANVPATKTDTPDDKIPHRDGTGSYVIELAAGEAARAGITRGTMLDVSAVVPGKD
jgi:uncharacterized protein